MFYTHFILTKQIKNECTQQIEHMCITSDAEPTLYKCYTNVLCLLGSRAYGALKVNIHTHMNIVNMRRWPNAGLLLNTTLN